MEKNEIEMVAHEAFIKRAAEIDAPFMLKGSYVTRQYFDKPEDRRPNDLDWVCLENFADPNDAEDFFSDWAAKVTAVEKDDGVKFRSFRENEFWRMIDYAMADDFPTVNTDILCWVDEKPCEFSFDLSFNLDITVPPISLTYRPLRGKIFEVPQTVPLPLQISWKLHQTIVRPRFKDIFDLIYLMNYPAFDREMRNQTLQALAMECNAGDVNKDSVKKVFSGDLSKIYSASNIEREWTLWRHQNNSYGLLPFSYGFAKHITDADKLPMTWKVFEEKFKAALLNAGITPQLVEEMPINSKPTLLDHLKRLLK